MGVFPPFPTALPCCWLLGCRAHGRPGTAAWREPSLEKSLRLGLEVEARDGIRSPCFGAASPPSPVRPVLPGEGWAGLEKLHTHLRRAEATRASAIGVVRHEAVRVVAREQPPSRRLTVAERTPLLAAHRRGRYQLPPLHRNHWHCRATLRRSRPCPRRPCARCRTPTAKHRLSARQRHWAKPRLRQRSVLLHGDVLRARLVQARRWPLR